MRKGSKDKAAMIDSAERREPVIDSHNPDEDALEAGVAAIFAAIQADGFEESHDGETEEVDPTLVLLAELNRIWASPAPG